MSWLILLLLVLATGTALSYFARAGRGTAEMIGAALLVGIAGYTWQGSPGLPGSPTPPRANHPTSDPLFAAERKLWLGEVGPEADLLAAADTFIAQGDASYAVGILRGAIGRAPENMALWIGLGNALATYADGSVTPPARYAFARAATLAPHHPAPAYFLGLAYAQGGNIDEADHIWRTLLAGAPTDAKWRPLVASRIALLARLRAAMTKER